MRVTRVPSDRLRQRVRVRSCIGRPAGSVRKSGYVASFGRLERKDTIFGLDAGCRVLAVYRFALFQFLSQRRKGIACLSLRLCTPFSLQSSISRLPSSISGLRSPVFDLPSPAFGLRSPTLYS